MASQARMIENAIRDMKKSMARNDDGITQSMLLASAFTYTEFASF